MKALVVGFQFKRMDLSEDEAVEKLMNDFDTSHDKLIEKKEFIEGVSKWLNEAKRSSTAPPSGPNTGKFLTDFHRVRSFSSTL